ncbi:MAG: 30S ribosomal protein S3 [Candidatus Hydrothermarchaeaceae archaeon]
MGIKRKFIADNYRKLEVKEFLEDGLDRAGCGEIDIQRTPLGTRVIVFAQRPGLVIGRKGGSIRKFTNILQTRYHIDNPQIEVNELDISELNAKVMAKSVASAIERGIHFRRAAYTALRRIMEAGARGVEIKVSGKLTGDRSKTVKFMDGSMKHCGEPALLYVDVGKANASPKPGIIGVTVKLIPPGVRLPDEIVFLEKETEKPEEISVVDDDKEIKPEKVERKAEKKKPEGEETEKPEEAPKKAPKAKKTEEKKKSVKKDEEKPEEAPKKTLKTKTAVEKKKAVKKEEPKKTKKATAKTSAKPKSTKSVKKKASSKPKQKKEVK